MESLDTLIPVSQRPLRQPAANAGVGVVPHLTADVRDKPRNRPLVRMEIHNRCTAVLTLPHANSVPPGQWTISCYDDEVAAVLSMVEPKPDRLRDAQQQFQRSILAEAKKKLESYQGTVDDLEEEIAKGTAPPELKAEIDAILRETEVSVESVFHAMMERDVKPLVSAKLVEGSEHQEPKRVEQVKEQNALADAMGAAISRELPVAMKAAMGEFADQLFAKLAPLLQGNQSKGGGDRR